MFNEEFYQYKQGFLDKIALERTLDDIASLGFYEEWEDLGLVELLYPPEWKAMIESKVVGLGEDSMSSKIPRAISFTGVANFLGVVGVIGSLIFVGLELQQSQKIALGGQQQARTALIAELWLAGLEGESETLTAM